MDEVKTEIWFNLLSDLPFEQATANLRNHIRTSSFVPTPADIICQDSSQFMDYDQLKLETAERMHELESWQKIAIDCPEHLQRRMLKGGDAGD
jgi:hypothetical protein